MTLTGHGYVSKPAENTLPGVKLQQFASDLEQGDGNELEGKFLAAHSSSALAVNCFAPFKDAIADLSLLDANSFEEIQFERKCPTGLRGGRAPNLDVVAEAKAHVVAIESKCTEYLSTKPAKFSPAYAEQIRDERRESAWFREMLDLDAGVVSYRFLDTAQLVKHAFGVARCFKGKSATLLYLYWEPANAADLPEFGGHGEEIARLGERVDGAFPRFEALSYPELWMSWETSRCPPWLRDHLLALRARYLVAI
ncbi:MAG: hypothetical protein QF384_03405 [Alphaproteobacteria bacterium]|nr:hypothetical protein [Alphaproteobacteria bacterium]